MPLLSILIPAFNYKNGVNRIIDSMNCIDDIEIIIFDDSSHNDISQEYANNKNIIYRKNTPPLGAVNNWNALLNVAKGDYCWIIHHDEYPILVDELIDILKAKKCDVLITSCRLFSAKKFYTTTNMFTFIKRIVALYFPGYIFKRNLFGSVSNFIIKSDKYPRFDVNLRWLVDVDLIYRLIEGGLIIYFLNRRIFVASEIDRAESITSKIQADLKSVLSYEKNYLNMKYSQKIYWLNVNNVFLSFIELIIIALLKFLNLVLSFRIKF